MFVSTLPSLCPTQNANTEQKPSACSFSTKDRVQSTAALHNWALYSAASRTIMQHIFKKVYLLSPVLFCILNGSKKISAVMFRSNKILQTTYTYLYKIFYRNLLYFIDNLVCMTKLCMHRITAA